MVFSSKAIGWIVDFFDGIFDIREGFAKVYEGRNAGDEPCISREQQDKQLADRAG